MAELHVQKKRNNYWWVWLIIVLLIIAAAVYYYMNYYRKPGNATGSANVSIINCHWSQGHLPKKTTLFYC